MLIVVTVGALLPVTSAPAAADDWAIVASPNTASNHFNIPSRIACVSTTECWAVGRYTPAAIYKTLIQRWDGTSWEIVPSPNVGTSTNTLEDVACWGPAACIAVGYAVVASRYQTLIERWNGTTWSVVPSPNTDPTLHNYLYGLTCVSATACWAVGASGAAVHGTNQTLTVRWDGASWSIVPSPNTNPTKHHHLYSATCVTELDCWAVGIYDDGLGYKTLIERWDGASWAIVPSPNTSPTLQQYLRDVACAAADDCWAVGEHHSDDDVFRTLIEHWDGAAWSIAPSPNSPTDDNQLSNVTCASTTMCWAVGSYSPDKNISPTQTVIQRWDGAAWAVVPSPNTRATQHNYFYGVACISTEDCWVVGSSATPGTSFQTLMAHYPGPPLAIPGAPQILRPTPGELVEVSPVPVSGTAAAGMTVEISDGDAVLANVPSGDTGDWSVELPLADGSHVLSVVAVNPAGARSAAATRTFSVDTSVLAVPAISSPGVGARLAATSVTIAGTSMPDSTVIVTENGAALGSVPAAPDGAWSFVRTFPDGTHSVSATATDARGRTSPTSQPRSFSVDTIAPEAPVITLPSADATLGDATVLISGTDEPGSIVTVREGDSTVGVTATDDAGGWSLSVGMPNGGHVVTAVATDTTGNSSPPSAPRAFEIADTTPPPAPAIANPLDGATVDVERVVVDGAAAPRAVIDVLDGAMVVAHTTAAATGTWRLVLWSLSPGEHALSAVATDTAGNTGPSSAVVTLTAQPPGPSGIAISSPAPDSIHQRSVAFTGTHAVANARVELWEDEIMLGAVTAGADGVWSMGLSMETGTHSVVAADALGARSTAVRFAVDDIAPSVAIASPARPLVLPDETIRIDGTAADNLGVVSVTVTYRDALMRPVLTTMADCTCGAAGTAVSWTSSPSLPSGSYTVVARALDVAGNVSPERRMGFVKI